MYNQDLIPAAVRPPAINQAEGESVANLGMDSPGLMIDAQSDLQVLQPCHVEELRYPTLEQFALKRPLPMFPCAEMEINPKWAHGAMNGAHEVFGAASQKGIPVDCKKLDRASCVNHAFIESGRI